MIGGTSGDGKDEVVEGAAGERVCEKSVDIGEVASDEELSISLSGVDEPDVCPWSKSSAVLELPLVVSGVREMPRSCCISF